MKKGAFLISLFLALATFSPQTYGQGVWKSLSEVTYKISKDNFGELYVPVFSENIKKLEGKVVEADGYIIPFEGMFKPTHIILSSLPLAECFFCGSGGPETVMEVMLTSPMKYESKRVKVWGKPMINTA